MESDGSLQWIQKLPAKAREIQSTPSHPKRVIPLFTKLRLGLSRGLYPSGLPTKFCMHFSLPSCFSHFVFLIVPLLYYSASVFFSLQYAYEIQAAYSLRVHQPLNNTNISIILAGSRTAPLCFLRYCFECRKKFGNHRAI